ncbi:DgyrCDS4299 [Dimorphilus gyrociliatus]|uniref:DgyrCDS4299 n=1 Tax=Dimorphilus gyrociliatus TaxID=2664684 RepID=A0A7I8VG81_9ANNE|nr:DgyrCDS4299 [Dimorphilus gyrociliatus]
MLKFFVKKKGGSKTPSPTGSLASLQSQDGSGYSVKEKDLPKLHKAAWIGDFNKLNQLIKKGDYNSRDKENRTALHLACANGNVDIVDLLLEWKAKPDLLDKFDRSPLMKAVQCKKSECVKLLLESHANPNLVDKNGGSCLHYAVENNDIYCLEELFKSRKLNTELTNKMGDTALHLAVKGHNQNIAQLLLKERVNPNCQNNEGKTPLMIACFMGEESTARLCLNFGANAGLKDNKGKTADDYALLNNHDSCRVLLQESPSDANAPLHENDEVDNDSRNEALDSIRGKDNISNNSQSVAPNAIDDDFEDSWDGEDETSLFNSISMSKKPNIDGNPSLLPINDATYANIGEAQFGGYNKELSDAEEIDKTVPNMSSFTSFKPNQSPKPKIQDKIQSQQDKTKDKMDIDDFDSDETISDVSDIEASAKSLLKNENIPKTLDSKQEDNSDWDSISNIEPSIKEEKAAVSDGTVIGTKITPHAKTRESDTKHENFPQDDSQWDSESKEESATKAPKKDTQESDDPSQWDSEPIKSNKEVILVQKKNESTWDSGSSDVESFDEVKSDFHKKDSSENIALSKPQKSPSTTPSKKEQNTAHQFLNEFESTTAYDAQENTVFPQNASVNRNIHDSNVQRLEKQLALVNEELDKEKASKLTLETKKKNLENENSQLLKELETDIKSFKSDDEERLFIECEAMKMEYERKIKSSEKDLQQVQDDYAILYQKYEAEIKEKTLVTEALERTSLKHKVELTKLNGDISILKSEKEHFQSNFENMAKFKLLLETEKNELASTLSNMRDQQQEESDLTTQKLSNVEQDNQELHKDLENLKVKVCEYKAEIKEKSLEIEKYKKELDSLSELNEKFQSEKETNIQLQVHLNELQIRCSELRKENESVQKGTVPVTTHSLLENSLEILKNDRKETEDKLQESIYKYREEAAILKCRNERLEVDISKSKTDFENQQIEIDKMKTTCASSQQIISELQNEVKNLTEKLTTSQKSADKNYKNYTEAKEKSSETVLELENVKRIYSESQQQLAVKTEIIKNLEKLKNELEIEAKQLQIQLNEANKSLNTEIITVENLKAKVDELNQLYKESCDKADKLQIANNKLEYRINEVEVAQSQAINHAQDSKSLWETEVKSKSALGIRIAELERGKQESLLQIQAEKQKMRKVLELKKVAETKMEGLMESNDKLEKEVNLLKTHLKIAKKRLKETGNGKSLKVQTSTKLKSLMEKYKSRSSALKQLQLDYRNLEISRDRLLEEFNDFKVFESGKEQTRHEWEIKAKDELNRQLKEMNARLEEESQVRQQNVLLKEKREIDLIREMEHVKNDVILAKQQASQVRVEKDAKDREIKRLRELYDDEVKQCAELSKQLQLSHEKYLQFGLSGRSRFRLESMNPSDKMKDINESFRTDQSVINSIQQQLDCSIAKHMEKTQPF